MKKILIFMIILFPVLTGCQTGETPEDKANNTEFNVSFNELNNETNKATFTVNGYPNEEEFNQIETIVDKSLDKQGVTETTEVKVYGDFQNQSEEPIYGTLIYKDGKVVTNNLKNISVDKYINKAVLN